MGNNTDKSNSKRVKIRRRKPCLMAYTLNNTQPVICTIVADQPYFYMEEENIIEDDVFACEEFAALEKDIADMKRKMAAYENMSRGMERDPKARLTLFADNAASIAPQRENETAADAVTKNAAVKDAIIEIASGSRMVKTLLGFAADNGIEITQSRQVFSAYYDKKAGKILIHPELEEAKAVLLLARELRRHWQHKNGALIHPMTFHPDQAILVNRAQAADLTASMIRCAWELQLAGYRAAWEAMELSNDADLARSFAREALVDFRSIADGKAMAAVFEGWFMSERRRYHDKKLIQAMLADHAGYVFSCADTSRHVTLDLMAALGEQPYGKNYLAPYAAMIVEDPLFTEVCDRSNANFLWFIKFERSFRETEQALQSEGGLSSESGNPPLSSPLKTDQAGHEPDATVISIRDDGPFIHRRKKPFHAEKLEDSASGTNVIHVRFGNAEQG
ncbi:MAG: DUF6782 family putative metallopeptidase [Micavibrio sp.]